MVILHPSARPAIPGMPVSRYRSSRVDKRSPALAALRAAYIRVAADLPRDVARQIFWALDSVEFDNGVNVNSLTALTDAINEGNMESIAVLTAAINERKVAKSTKKRRTSRNAIPRSSGAVRDALENGAKAEAIREFANKFPRDLQEMVDGYLPLHLAIINGRWDAVQVLVDAWPPAAKTRSEDGSLPLHLAAIADAPLPIVQLLVAEHPFSARMKEAHGFLPLHLAVAHGCRLDIVDFLLDTYKRGLRVKDKGGLLPLHVAAINGARLEIVQVLSNLYPRALHEESSCGFVPLHFAAQCSRLELVQLFAHKNPKALIKKTSGGCLPVHVAVRDNAQPEVVEFLARGSGACRVIVPFLAQITERIIVPRRHRRLLLRITKLQALSRRFLVYREYKDAISLIRSRVQYMMTWSKVVELAGQTIDTDANTESTWTLLRERHCDVEQWLRAELFQKLDEAMLECSVKGSVPIHGEGASSTACGDGRELESRDRKDSVLDDRDENEELNEDNYVPFHEIERSLPNPVKATNRVFLTNAVLKWCRASDPTYVGFFVRRIQQLASGQRSRILAKRLTGCFKATIFETYLEQKSGHRIIWTVEALGEVLVWNVVKHKEVFRFARLIGSSLGRTNRQLSDALSTLGIRSMVETASSHADAIVLDPQGNTPLKLFTVEREHAQKLADPSWTPPLRLTPEERAIVESTGTTLVLGRSGTGKTICLCNKIDFDCHLSGGDHAFTQLFVSRSDRLCRFVKKAVGSEHNCSFTTFNALLLQLESDSSTKVNFPTSKRVDFERFKREFYRESKLWGDVDALVAWTNIRSFIKGSTDALSSPSRSLSEEDYVLAEKLGKKRCRLSPNHRHEVYKVFRAYSKHLAENRLWDDCDRISHLLETLQALKLDDPERFESLRHSKLYVDECQDFTQAEILLFFYLSRSGDLFLCGDPAQSVVEGVQFRFNEIRSVAHVVAGTERRHLIPDKPMTVNLNFRSHCGIMDIAAAVLKRMFTVFPAGANKLDRSLFDGPRPGVMYELNVGLLKDALASVLSGSTVLVLDEHEASRKRDLCGYKQLYGIREAKGLEFKSVIVFDFFSGIPQELQKPLRNLLLGRERLDFPSRFPEVEGYLKLLYTAITRSVDRLLFVESKPSIAGEAFIRWSTTTTTRVRSRHEEPLAVVQEISGIAALEMSVDEWILAGFDNAEAAEATEDLKSSISFFDAAIHCFQKARKSRFIAKAKVNLTSVRCRHQMTLDAEYRHGEASAMMTEREMAGLVSQLLREKLWMEAAKFILAVLPHLSEYTQCQLRTNLLPQLPSV